MTATRSSAKRRFFVEIIKPSHYDDNGYVIQWRRAFVPSNSLACVWALVEDAKERQVLGEDVEIVIDGYDETHTVIRTRELIKRIRQGDGGMVLMVGVQSNQFPRTVDLAREFRNAGIPVAIGGFHVSGCLAMLPELPPDIRAAQEMGITIFAGEAEGHIDGLLQDAYHGRMRPVYNYLDDLPDLPGQVIPRLPVEVTRRTWNFTAFDAGRGCPFRCSFCTIINVQGRKSRSRDADDVEHIVRAYVQKGINQFFITDDNMARNRNWEAIFDRLIQLRKEGINLKLVIQVDTMCHKIPGFIDKAAQAGCKRVFIGMENINPENLVTVKKFQNKFSEYRKMLQAWRAHGVLTIAGYILGFPADTPESIERDIHTIQRELPVDILEFFCLTPLPGSADHKDLHARGVWMDPDMNVYDAEHVTTGHARMNSAQWRDIYHRAWHLYYSPEHVETMLRRAQVSGAGGKKMVSAIMTYYGSYRFEHVHPLQGGILRRKVRTTRRPSFPRENPLVFYPRRLWETISTYCAAGWYYLKLERLRCKIARDSRAKQYMDRALTPVSASVEELTPAAEHESCASSAAPASAPLIQLSMLGQKAATSKERAA
jgi:radical SAM superfamily enzyme YgiQ (UPF0313 family)